MIARMRHNLVLSLYSTVTLAGLAVFAYGVFNFVGALIFTVVAARSGAAAQGFSVGAAVCIVLVYLAVAIVGGLVAVFAGRTWWWRRRAGPAPEQASVARTSLGRILATLIFGAFAFVSGLTLYYASGKAVRDSALAVGGTTTVGHVVSYQPNPEVHEDAFRVHYGFSTADGRYFVGVGSQWRWQIEALHKAGGATTVTYVPDHPQISEMDFSFDWRQTLALLGQQFAVFAVGIWGAGKNMGIWPSPRNNKPAGATSLQQLAARRNGSSHA